MQEVGAAAQLRGVGHPLFQGPQCLGEGRLESPLDGHHLTGRFHLGPKSPIARRELIERPARNLDHAVVQSRLEGGRRLARHRVGDLMQQAAGGDLGGHPGDRVPGRLRGQCR